MIIAAIVAAQTMLSNFPVDPHRDVIEADGKLYVMMPAQFVIAGDCRKFSWSRDGKYLFALSHPRRQFNAVEELLPSPTHALQPGERLPSAVSFTSPDSLCLLDATSGRAVPLAEHVDEAEWLPGTDNLVILAESLDTGRAGTPHLYEQLLSWSPGNGLRTLSSGIDDDSDPILWISTSQPFGFLICQQPPLTSLISDNADSLIPLKDPKPPSRVVFDEHGNASFLHLDKGATRETQTRYNIDPRTGALTATTQPWTLVPEMKAETRFSVKSATHHITAGSKTVEIPGEWLESGDDPKHVGLIAAYSGQATVSPASNVVAYEQSGAVFYRKIVEGSLDVIRRWTESFDNTQAMLRARSVGAAIAHFLTDSHGVFPTAEGLAAITPYLNDSDALEGFHYSLNGQNVKDFGDTSQVVMGYVETGTGQAVVYADTHVRFIKH